MDDNSIDFFEGVVRRSHLYTDEEVRLDITEHPFDIRNIHPLLPEVVRNLFDDGYYAQATLEVFKFLEKNVARLAGSAKFGTNLMMEVFKDTAPLIQLTPLKTASEQSEQKGYQLIFAGSVMAVRNPRGHEYKINDSMDDCLDHLSLVSLLIRRLEKAGFRFKE